MLDSELYGPRFNPGMPRRMLPSFTADFMVGVDCTGLGALSAVRKLAMHEKTGVRWGETYACTRAVV